MYIFNRVTVVPQLPENLKKLSEISNNLWWSWNTEFLRLFEVMDMDLWESVGKNPVKFLKHISQEKIEFFSNNQEFLEKYNKVVANYEGYINSRDTWFNKNYSNNKANDLIAYFSAE